MKNRKQIVFGVIVAIIVLLNIPLPASFLVRSGVRDNMAAYQTLLTILITRIGSTLTFVWDADGIIREKQQMQEEIANLRFRMQGLKALEDDNETLRALLKFKGQQKYRLIMCQIVSRGGMGGWWQTLQLNKGTEQGVGANLAVMTMDGLIGRTGEIRGEGESSAIVVSRRTSDVLLLTDPDCRVSCKLPRTGALGIVRGRGGALGGDTELEMLCSAEPSHMDYIPKTARIQVNDEVVTSGLGGVYPEGLVVGTVQKVSMDRSGLYQKAEIQLAANLSAVKYAFVVIPEASVEQKSSRDIGRRPAPAASARDSGESAPVPGTEGSAAGGRRIPSYKRPLPVQGEAEERVEQP